MAVEGGGKGKGGIADREWEICLDFFYCGAIERFQGYCVAEYCRFGSD